MKKVCGFEGCRRRHKSRGLCLSHYQQWYRGQELTPLRRYSSEEEVYPEGTRICSFEGCGRKHKSGGLCLSHYQQKLRGQALKPLGLPRGRNGGRRRLASA